MVQTLKGGQKYRNTMIKKFGSLEAWKEYQRRNASIGGRNGKSGGFASDEVGADCLTGRERASRVGKIGGLRSKRLPNKRLKQYAKTGDL